MIEATYERALTVVARRRIVAGKYLAVSVLNVINHQVLLNVQVSLILVWKA